MDYIEIVKPLSHQLFSKCHKKLNGVEVIIHMGIA